MNKSMLRTLQAATILTVLVLLLSINLGQADHDWDSCVDMSLDLCFDCSLNPDHRFCSWEYIDRNTPYPKYAWITFALDWECNLYIADRQYSSTPCSVVAPDNATDQSFSCQRSSMCEDFNPDEPYRSCTELPYQRQDAEKLFVFVRSLLRRSGYGCGRDLVGANQIAACNGNSLIVLGS